MSKRVTVLGSLVAMLVAVGCSSRETPHTEVVASATQAIQGGTTDAAHPFAVGIGYDGKSKQAIRCSGTLVLPNMVLTARHCVETIAQTASPGGHHASVAVADPKSLRIFAVIFAAPPVTGRPVEAE